MWYCLAFFALALNIDALGVGFSYGIRRIRIPLLSMVIICLMSMAAISVSMLAGHIITHLIPPLLSKHIGGVILLLLGSYAIYQYIKQKGITDKYLTGSNHKEGSQQEPVTLLEIRFLGVMIQILKEPHIADMDYSGIISGREAFLLGLALSLDSLGAGIAVSLLGYNVLDTALCVGASQFIFTYLGLITGGQLSNRSFGRQLAVLPGLILILLGLTRL